MEDEPPELPDDVQAQIDQLQRWKDAQNRRSAAWKVRNPDKMKEIRRNRYHRLKADDASFLEREAARKKQAYRSRKGEGK